MLYQLRYASPKPPENQTGVPRTRRSSVKAHSRFTHSTAQKSRLAHPRRGSKPERLQPTPKAALIRAAFLLPATQSPLPVRFPSPLTCCEAGTMLGRKNEAYLETTRSEEHTSELPVT